MVISLSNLLLDLYANADETAGTIASLQQQVAQLEATNTLLLQRVNTLEAVTNSTNHNLVALTSDVAELDNCKLFKEARIVV